jgi:hypothetical protein
MVQRFADTPNLLAWEIINEPEWSVSGPGYTTYLVTKTEMRRFCGMIAAAVHANSDTMVTIGAAALKWNSNTMPPAEGNWWSDAALQAAFPSSDAYLDFYQVHYYDWMYNPSWGYALRRTRLSPHSGRSRWRWHSSRAESQRRTRCCAARPRSSAHPTSPRSSASAGAPSSIRALPDFL